MSQVARRWHGQILTIPSSFHQPLLPGSGSVQISDTEYRWRSKGTGSKVVVSRHRRLIAHLKKTQPHLLLSPARKQRHQRNSHSIPLSNKKEYIQKTQRHEPRNLRGRLPCGGSRLADIYPRMEGKAGREIEDFGYGVSNSY